ncbi:MAG TPA: hypothetical protein VF950_24860 [Planctomycetota bacterium]
MDLLLGRVALERGLISEAQLRDALSERALSVARGRKVPRPIGAILAAKKQLSDAQVVELTREIEGRIEKEAEGRRKDAFLGQILIDADLVAPKHVEDCLFDQAERWKEGETPLPRLGDLLVLKGYATREDVAQALALQKSMVQVCAKCRRECSLSDDVDRCPVCGGAFKPRAESAVIPPRPVVAPAAPAPDVATLGRYQLRATLEKSDAAVLYDAHDAELDRRVSLRVLERNRPEDVERARAAAALKHPNIAAIYDSGLLDGRPYVAAERVEGRSLGELRKSGALKARQEIRALRDVALALDHAHQRGLVHRDLNPESVRFGAQDRPLIVDLWAGAAASPAHMSPERARGDRDLGPAADVWSLGVLLYEALAGAPPFHGDTPESTLSKVMCESPAPPSAAAPSKAGRAVYRPLETLCLRALEKKPSRRPASAKAFADELSAWLKGEAEAAPRPKRVDRRRRWIAIAAGALVGVAGLIAAFALATRESRTDRTLRKAAEYMAEGHPDAALQLYDRILEREPGEPRALTGREAARARIDADEARVKLEETQAELERVRRDADRPRRPEAQARD